MSAQRLSDRKTRAVARATGQAVVRAWSHGGYTFAFVTTDHRHGAYDTKTGFWQWDPDPLHYTSCADLFPEPSQ